MVVAHRQNGRTAETQSDAEVLLQTNGVARLVQQNGTAKTNGYKLEFRPAGSPAGTWHHTAWWHCVLYDPYERVNVWSHFIPGLLFAMLAVYAPIYAPNAARPLTLFAACAASTQLLSALTHVWPDSHGLEKLDHLGIVALIIGTPLTALMANEHGHIPKPMQYATIVMIAAAFLRPMLRVVGFAAGSLTILGMYAVEIYNTNLLIQLALYAAGGVTFLRNGGHSRWTGFSDHHLLHYLVTTACTLHIFYILEAVKREGAAPL